MKPRNLPNLGPVPADALDPEGLQPRDVTLPDADALRYCADLTLAVRTFSPDEFFAEQISMLLPIGDGSDEFEELVFTHDEVMVVLGDACRFNDKLLANAVKLLDICAEISLRERVDFDVSPEIVETMLACLTDDDYIDGRIAVSCEDFSQLDGAVKTYYAKYGSDGCLPLPTGYSRTLRDLAYIFLANILRSLFQHVKNQMSHGRAWLRCRGLWDTNDALGDSDAAVAPLCNVSSAMTLEESIMVNALDLDPDDQRLFELRPLITLLDRLRDASKWLVSERWVEPDFTVPTSFADFFPKSTHHGFTVAAVYELLSGTAAPDETAPPHPIPLTDATQQKFDTGIAPPKVYQKVAARLARRATAAKAQWDEIFLDAEGIVSPSVLWKWDGSHLHNHFYGYFATDGSSIHALFVEAGMRPHGPARDDAKLARVVSDWVGAADSDGYAGRLAAIGGHLPAVSQPRFRGKGFQDPDSRDVHAGRILLPANWNVVVMLPGHTQLTARVVSAGLIAELQRLVRAYRSDLPARVHHTYDISNDFEVSLNRLSKVARDAAALINAHGVLAAKLGGAQAGFDFVMGKVRAHVEQARAKATADFKDQFIARELEHTLINALAIAAGSPATVNIAFPAGFAPLHDVIALADAARAAGTPLKLELSYDDRLDDADDNDDPFVELTPAAAGALIARKAISCVVVSNMHFAQRKTHRAADDLLAKFTGDAAAVAELERWLRLLALQHVTTGAHSLAQHPINAFYDPTTLVNKPAALAQLTDACRGAVVLMGDREQFAGSRVHAVAKGVTAHLRAGGVHTHLVNEEYAARWCAVCVALNPTAAPKGECDLVVLPDRDTVRCPRCHLDVGRDVNVVLNLLMSSLDQFVIVPAQPEFAL
ncbi:hypothetical protein H9P43_004178 [Blastocladiella emersonii ATCC 22665]|nr:hypothetical protein H9P43_004178 [Blastocladiella emersonii ATCC 22665]